MGNPFEYRELMQAHMHYEETRTPEQVAADQKRRHDDAVQSRGKGRKASAGSDATPVSSLPQGEVDKVLAILANAKPRPNPLAE